MRSGPTASFAVQMFRDSRSMSARHQAPQTPGTSVPDQSLASLFRRFIGFGSLAWGGPVAQIAMLRRELVDRERWISSERFNRTLAVYQALPGPEAHELCVYFGYLARGRIGGVVAGLGFMLPGLLLMLLFSWFYVNVGIASPWFLAAFAGCQAGVLALIVRAVHRIGSHALTDRWLAAISVLALFGALAGIHFAAVLPVAGIAYFLVARGRHGWAIALIVVVVGSIAGYALTSGAGEERPPRAESAPSAAGVGGQVSPVELAGSGVRAGLLTFGGAYTAIPFLQEDAVENGGWMTSRTFLDGVALSGILPAPLIIFSTFVGYVAGGLVGGLAMTAGIFAPAFLFTLVGHRHLERLVEHRATHAVLDGITAGVVGLIGATTLLLAPVAIRGVAGAAIFGLALISLYAWRAGAIVPAVVTVAGGLGLLLFGVFGLSG